MYCMPENYLLHPPENYLLHSLSDLYVPNHIQEDFDKLLDTIDQIA